MRHSFYAIGYKCREMWCQLDLWANQTHHSPSVANVWRMPYQQTCQQWLLMAMYKTTFYELIHYITKIISHIPLNVLY